jgi:hypothetical protein
MHGNSGVGTVTAGAIDWATVDRLVQGLGPRTRGLVAVRNVVGLRAWLPAAAEMSRAPQLAEMYVELARLVGAEPWGAA